MKCSERTACARHIALNVIGDGTIILTITSIETDEVDTFKIWRSL